MVSMIRNHGENGTLGWGPFFLLVETVSVLPQLSGNFLHKKAKLRSLRAGFLIWVLTKCSYSNL